MGHKKYGLQDLERTFQTRVQSYIISKSVSFVKMSKPMNSREQRKTAEGTKLSNSAPKKRGKYALEASRYNWVKLELECTETDKNSLRIKQICKLK